MGRRRQYNSQLGAGQHGVRSPAGVKRFYIFQNAIQPPNQWVRGVLFAGIKRPGSKSDHSLLYSARLKTRGAMYLPSVYSNIYPYMQCLGPVIFFYKLHVPETNAYSRTPEAFREIISTNLNSK